MFDSLWLSPKAGRYAYFAGGTLWQADALASAAPIFRVRVTRAAPALKGAFCDAGDRSVLLSCGKEPVPAVGEYVYVQEEEAASGTKLAVCGLHPVLAGDYVLYYPDRAGLRFAKALSQEVRTACTAAFPEGVGCLVRTSVGVQDVPKALEELHAIQALWYEKTRYVGVGMVYKGAVDYRRYMRAARETTTDDQVLAERYGLRYAPDLALRFEREVDPVLAGLHRVVTAGDVELVVEKTEAAWVVDVNGKGHVLDTPDGNAALAVNLTAGEEILRQINLRNMTGMILVDFVSMPAKYGETLMAALRKAAETDERLRVVDMTALGVVEMTRSHR